MIDVLVEDAYGVKSVRKIDNQYIEIGDLLDDGCIVIDIYYPDDADDDMEALDEYDI